MRHAISIPVLAAIFTLPAILAVIRDGSAADKPATPVKKPATPVYLNYSGAIVAPRPDAVLDKVKALGERLGQALNRAVDVLSGNEAEFLAKNKTALLSGNEAELLAKNKTALLSGNSPRVLNGEKPKVLSENKTAVLSGNKAEGNTMNLFSNMHLFSDIRVEVHTSISGTNAGNTMLNMGEKEKEMPSKTSSVTATTIAPSYQPAISSPYSPGPSVLVPTPSSYSNPYGSSRPGANPYSPYGSSTNPYAPAVSNKTAPASSTVVPTAQIESLRQENEWLRNRLNMMSEQLRQMKEQLGRTSERLERLNRDNLNPKPPVAAF